MNGLTRPALVLLDYQVEIVEMLTAGGSGPAVRQAVRALVAARAAGVPVVFVRVAYRPGYVDASLRNLRVSMLRANGRLADGTPGADIVADLTPRTDEPIIIKRRVSALAHTDLVPVLNALEVETLVLCGLATSGAVLSTVRQAADADYRIVVLADACADADPQAHEFLTGKIFPTQARVLGTEEFERLLASSP